MMTILFTGKSTHPRTKGAVAKYLRAHKIAYNLLGHTECFTAIECPKEISERVIRKIKSMKYAEDISFTDEPTGIPLVRNGAHYPQEIVDKRK